MNQVLKFIALFLSLLLNFVGLFPLFAATITSDKIEVGSSTSDIPGVDSSHQSEESGSDIGNTSDTVQESTNSTSPATDAFLLPEVVVYGRADSLLGIAGAASQGTVGKDELEWRPLSRPGEVLETVPGVILTQHSGAVPAKQISSFCVVLISTMERTLPQRTLPHRLTAFRLICPLMGMARAIVI